MPIKDDSLVSQYIRSIENPDSIGYRDGRWYAPDESIYDRNNRGFGMDVNYNTATVDLTKNRPGKYLTEEEERELRLQHIKESERVLDNWTPQILQEMPSEKKRAMAVGMLYRGDGIKSIIRNPTINKAYLYGTDADMQKAVSDYYQSKKVSERAQRHNDFFNPQMKNTSDSIPNSIKRATPYTLPKFDTMQFTPKKKYDDGGYLGNDWDALSYRDKAEMMKVAIANGITTLPEIKEAYNEFAKGGRMKWTMEDEAGYRYWRSRLPRNLRETNDADYDMKAAYKAGMEPQWNEGDKSYHLGSRDPQSGRILKAAHHPTFLKALLTDASMGYYPVTDDKGNTYTETWKGNHVYAGGGKEVKKPSLISNLHNFTLDKDKLKERFYNHFDPYLAYTDDAIERAVDLVIGGPEYAKEDYFYNNRENPFFNKKNYREGATSAFDDAVWGTYLTIPRNKRKYKSDLNKSLYKPTKGNDSDTYYTIPINEEVKRGLIQEGLQNLKVGENKNTKALFGYNMGTSTLGRGVDESKGDYISYYDKWDINPLHGDYSNNTLTKTHPILSKLIPKDGSDVFDGITNPVSFYDRIYLDDYYGVNSGADEGDYYGGYLPEVTVFPNKFANGGYIPSESIKRKIANWEGSSMKTNRNFEAEAKDFNNVIPVNVRNKLSSRQLDALYSYGYNVGMGRLKERVVPTLTAYTQGKASKEDVQRSMWASRDNELRGLTTRRNAEREMFGGNYRTKFTGTGKLGLHINPNEYTYFEDLSPMISDVVLPQMQMSDNMDIDPSTLYKTPTIDNTLFSKPVVDVGEVDYNPQQDRLEGVRRFNVVMGMMGMESPLGMFGDNREPGLLDYVNGIYS